MTADQRIARVDDLMDQLLNQVGASIDFGKPGDCADFASAFKDLSIARKELEDE